MQPNGSWKIVFRTKSENVNHNKVEDLTNKVSSDDMQKQAKNEKSLKTRRFGVIH